MRWLKVTAGSAVMVALLLPGCLGSDTHWEVRGTFMDDATQSDLDDLRDRIRQHDGEMVVMESDPMQFSISVPSEADCEEVRAILGSAGYVDFYDECARVSVGGLDDGPQESPPY